MMDDRRLSDQDAYYAQIGFTGRVGFGTRPAILVIDMTRAVTEPGFPMHIDMERAIEYMQPMFALARSKGVPLVHTRGSGTPPHYADRGTFIKKIPNLRAYVEGSPLTELDPRTGPLPGEVVITKKYPSGFYGTNMQSLLTFLRVDTTIVVGNSTSGCVRATCVDACSGGFRVIVPRECSGDRVALSHEVNLFDIDAKYGDVVPARDVMTYLEALPPFDQTTPSAMPAGAAARS
jgi:nicotinamidase-related amidase